MTPFPARWPRIVSGTILRCAGLCAGLLVASGCPGPTPARPATDGKPGSDLNLAAPGPGLVRPGGGETQPPVGMGLPIARAAETAEPSSRGEAGPIRFRDMTAQTGIDFVHRSGNDSEKHFPANLGSGVALLDYDGDGRLDIYLVSQRMLPFSAPARSMGNRLYRNLGGFKFEDVTERARIGYTGFCHSAAVGDVNNDGRPDLLLMNLGPLVLYLNQGDGTFRDASSRAGFEPHGWSSGAAFLDYDGDGALDVYVTSYGRWKVDEEHEYCGDRRRGLRIYCSPFSIAPVRHHLYRGHGDGVFEDVTERAGVLRRDGRGLGVVAADLNGDGRTDLYVANDGCPNFLFLNRGDGTFEDVSESSGAATDQAGQVQGSMGVDVQDVDGDGRPDILVTNFRGQYDTLYHNVDGLNFQDISARLGLVADSRPHVGWGCALEDLEHDGWPDIFVVNGEVDDNLKEFGQDIPYEQPVVVFRNRQEGRRFVRAAGLGPFFDMRHPSRGAALGDLDDDGDLDVVINRQDRPPAVLSNESAPQGRWIRFQLEGRASNRSAIGAEVSVYAEGRVFRRQLKGNGSYLSAGDPRLLVGLGAVEKVDRAVIRWPRGRQTVLTSPALGRTHPVIEPEPEKRSGREPQDAKQG